MTPEQLAPDSEHQRKIVPMESLTERRKVATSQPVAANVVHRSIAPKQLVLKLREPEKMVPKGKTQGKNRGSRPRSICHWFSWTVTLEEIALDSEKDGSLRKDLGKEERSRPGSPIPSSFMGCTTTTIRFSSTQSPQKGYTQGKDS